MDVKMNAALRVLAERQDAERRALLRNAMLLHEIGVAQPRARIRNIMCRDQVAVTERGHFSTIPSRPMCSFRRSARSIGFFRPRARTWAAVDREPSCP